MQQTKQNKTIAHLCQQGDRARAPMIDDERDEYPLSAVIRGYKSKERWIWGLNEAMKVQQCSHRVR